MGSGRGRTAVRHDIMSKALLLMKGDKTTAARKLARSISERFFGLDTHEPPSPDPRTVQPPKPYATARDQSTKVFIYGLFSNVHNRIMYTGRTLSPEERMKQHGYKSSKCRLVRQAFHEHGSATFSGFDMAKPTLLSGSVGPDTANPPRRSRITGPVCQDPGAFN